MTTEHLTEPEQLASHFNLTQPGDYVRIDMADQTFDTASAMTIEGYEGNQLTDDIAPLATIETGDDRRFEVARDSSGFIGVLEEKNGSLVLMGTVLADKPIEITNGKHQKIIEIMLPASDPKDVGEVVTIMKPYTVEDTSSIVSVPAAFSTDRGNTKEDSDLKEHRRKWRKAKKIIAGVALGYSIFHSGGGVDATLDGLNDAHDTVYEANHMVHVGDKIDGYVVKDQERADDFNEGPNVVARTMDDLDGGRYDAIKKRAQEFMDLHKGEWLTDEQKDKLFQDIEVAESLQELESALEPVEELYELTFVFSLDDPYFDLNDVKYTAKSICEGMLNLPKSLVRQVGGIKKIAVHSKTSDSHANGTSVTAYYNGGKSEITVLTKSRIADAVMSQGVPGIADGDGIRSSYLHELGHALGMHGSIKGMDKDVLHGESFEEATSVGLEDAVDIGKDFVMGGLLNYPQAISTYSRANIYENNAENIAGVIDPFRSNGLAHPDEARRYQSPANRAMLRALSDMEERIPGIADYLVTLHPDLMNEK